MLQVVHYKIEFQNLQVPLKMQQSLPTLPPTQQKMATSVHHQPRLTPVMVVIMANLTMVVMTKASLQPNQSQPSQQPKQSRRIQVQEMVKLLLIRIRGEI